MTEKGFCECWTPNCQNKILEKEGDHKKLKVPCNESHTRMVCLECSHKLERRWGVTDA